VNFRLRAVRASLGHGLSLFQKQKTLLSETSDTWDWDCDYSSHRKALPLSFAPSKSICFSRKSLRWDESEATFPGVDCPPAPINQCDSSYIKLFSVITVHGSQRNVFP